MHTIPWTEIPGADVMDVGYVALMHVGGPTLAIEPTLAGCIHAAREYDMDVDLNVIDTSTDPNGLVCGDLVAVIVG